MTNAEIIEHITSTLNAVTASVKERVDAPGLTVNQMTDREQLLLALLGQCTASLSYVREKLEARWETDPPLEEGWYRVLAKCGKENRVGIAKWAIYDDCGNWYQYTNGSDYMAIVGSDFIGWAPLV